MFDIDGIKTESTTGYVGKDGFFWWVGEVEDNEDPMEIGRVKVRVLGHYTNFRGGTAGDLPTNYLPWATVLQHTSQAGNDGQGESSGQLQPGAIVMGFFMDGEYAQMPVVIGVMRIEKSDRTLQKRLFSFSNQTIPAGNGVNKSAMHPADRNVTNPELPLRQATTNVVAYPGQKTTNTGSDGSPKNVGSRSEISGSTCNPIKPIDPETPIPVANAMGGPWKSMEYKLAYLVEDVCNCISNLVKCEGYYLDVVSGKNIKEKDLTNNIRNYIGSVYAQIISVMRESMVNVVDELDKRKILTYSNGIPISVHLKIQTVISRILTESCTMDANLETYVNNSVKPVDDAVSKYISATITKDEMLKQSVDEIVNSIVTTTTTMVKEIGSLTAEIKSNVDGDSLETIENWEKNAELFFSETSLHVKHRTNLTGLMKVLISFTSAACDRKPSMHLSHMIGWFPLYGVTHTKEELEKLAKIRGDKDTRLFDAMFRDADPYLTTAKNYPNGSYDLYLGTPGRQGEVHKRANGTTFTSLTYNNAHYAEKVARDKFRLETPNATEEQLEAYIKQYVLESTGGYGDTGSLVADHVTYAGVLTQEVHGDDCKLVGRDYARTVEGDYYLKVTGNCHIEVGGGFHVSAEGYAGDHIQKHTLRFGSDVDMDVVGAKFEMQSSESVISSVMTKITGSMYENSCDQQNRSAIEMNLTADSSIMMSTPHLLTLVNVETPESPKKVTGIRTVVNGGVEILQSPTNLRDYRVSLTNTSNEFTKPLEYPDRYRIIRNDTYTVMAS